MRSQLNRSPLQRLLSVGRGVDSTGANGPDLAERLGAWLSVADAITLRTGLATVASVSATRPSQAAGQSTGLASELARVRATLTQSIHSLGAAPTPLRRGTGRAVGGAPVVLPPMDPVTEFTLLHQGYNDQQRRMDLAVGALRAHARQVLSASSPELARLAALDAVMEQLLGAREQNLLSTIPAFLKRDFERRRAAANSEQPQAAHASSADADAGWLTELRTAFQQTLLAELDLRLQPVLGLVQAQRQAPTAVAPQAPLAAPPEAPVSRD